MTPRQKKLRSHEMSFGEYIRKLRIEKYPELSGRKFAKEVGMTGPYLSNIELGKVPPPSAEKIIAIAEKLEVDKHKLLSKAGLLDPDFQVIFKDAPPEVIQFTLMFNKLLAGMGLEVDFHDFMALLVGKSLNKGEFLSKDDVMKTVFDLLEFLERKEPFSEEMKEAIEKGYAFIRAEKEPTHTDKGKNDT